MELVIVGYGNMAKAILCGILKQKKADIGISKITIAGRNPKKIESWLESFFYDNISEFKTDVVMLETYDIKCNNKAILLACKPSNLSKFSFSGFAEIVYSVLAGVTIQTLQTSIDAKNFVLIMPNVCAIDSFSSSAVLWEQNKLRTKSIKEVGKVLDSLVDNHNLHEVEQKSSLETKKKIEYFVSSFGNCVFVDTQKEINASIATNGSSPAVLALVAQALINAGVHQGLKLEASKKLVQKTFEGVAYMLQHISPQEIKDRVASPGGTTAEALLHCDIMGVQGNITQACIMAVRKAEHTMKPYELNEAL
ncbi:pyrroline-5-carboxylate reductase [Helicobacter didelphidarum]|uniref:Pyrroline-5-carboxylate reductase n=1 Tax=Helicobacter didelphidarum TaxID=2040648 RepID=A0A3D8IQN5_9HELI|nr:pyrroline-5-carboxylate reductase dimerization domain-containing protein [Helicobacter didelphidarum]RDU67502.1 pyrroline-5-carboxylate reductase [Helicobacter didelphidarum]